MDTSTAVRNATATFPVRLKEILKYRGLTQRDLAEAVGVTDCNVSQWTNGRVFPNTPALIGIATVTGVTSDWLLGLADPTWDISDSLSAAKYLGCSEPVAARLHIAGEAEKKYMRGSNSLDILAGSPLWTQFTGAVQKYVSDSTKKPVDPREDPELAARLFENAKFFRDYGYNITPVQSDAEKSLQEATKLLTLILETAVAQASPSVEDMDDASSD